MSRIPSVITLGSFDGVHLGHRSILQEVVRQAKACGARPVALVFDYPPKLTQSAITQRQLLTTLKEKKDLLQKLGVRSIDVLTFDRRTASLTAEQFFEKVIVGKHHARMMVVGPRVAFGRDRGGKLSVLRALGRKQGVSIRIVPMIGPKDIAVSSSRIREALQKGDTDFAGKALGYAYFLSGEIVHGSHRGRLLGFPTVNVRVDEGKILPPGVFRVRIEGLGTQVMDGICNVGTRPTFASGEKSVSVEVYVLHRRLGPMYGRRVKVSFFQRLREEKRFSSPEALVRQIEKDVTRVKRFSYNSGE